MNHQQRTLLRVSCEDVWSFRNVFARKKKLIGGIELFECSKTEPAKSFLCIFGNETS